MPRGSKRKASNNNNQGQNNSHHHQQQGKKSKAQTHEKVRASPKFYLQVPNTIRRQPVVATAALLGLNVDSTSEQLTKEIFANVAKNCPNVLGDVDVFRKLLTSTKPDIIDALLHQPAAPLLANARWDFDLVLLAVNKSPLFYLRLPEKFKNRDNSNIQRQAEITSTVLRGLTTNNKVYLTTAGSVFQNMANHSPYALGNSSVLRQLLTLANRKIIESLFSDEAAPLISNACWDHDLALLAVGKTPLFYLHLPKRFKKSNEEMAFAAMVSAKDLDNEDMTKILEDVDSNCPTLFSNSVTLQNFFGLGVSSVAMAVLAIFLEKIVWDQELVTVALHHCPDSYSFLPARFRNDNVEAQQVMLSLLSELENDDEEELALMVNGVISDHPGFFADQAALQQLFRWADREVISEIVKRTSATLPWNRDLMLLTRKRFYEGGDYYEDDGNLIYDDIEGMCNGSSDCRHLPLGTVLSYFVVDAIKEQEWPDFLNNCRCALSRDKLALVEVFNYVEPVLKSCELQPELCSWLQGLARRVRDCLQHQERFQTLLKCIFVAGRDEGGPLASFQGNDMGIALKREMAEFLDASITKTNPTILKQDAFELVYCLLTLPGEFVNEFGGPSCVLEYKEPYRPDESSLNCDWCCKTLSTLSEKYKDSAIDQDGSKEEN